MSIMSTDLRTIDIKIVKLLINDASLSNCQIGNTIGLSSSATNERVRKLKKEGHIKKIVALVDSNFMQMTLGAFIFVWVEGHDNNIKFSDSILRHDKILECHNVTGEYSYLVKVRCKNTASLELLITDYLKIQPGVTRTMTHIILSSQKERSLIVS